MEECKGVLAMRFGTANFETGETETEPSKRRHMFAVRSLKLTDHQLRRLKEGFQLFQRLQVQLAEQRQRIHQEGLVSSTALSPPEAAAAATESSGTSQVTQSARGALEPALASATAAEDFNSSTGARLEAEQAVVETLNKILFKQRMVAAMQMYFVIGSLSWQQYVRLRVLMAPFSQNGPMLQACILTYAAEMEQQQLQQMQKKKRYGWRQQKP